MKGFTLIEVLVTVLILAIVISGVLMSFVYCQRWIIEDLNRNNAMQIINERFEEIQRLPSAEAMNLIIQPAINKPELITKNISTYGTTNYFLTYDIKNILHPTTNAPSILIEGIVTWEDSKGMKEFTVNIITNDTQ